MLYTLWAILVLATASSIADRVQQEANKKEMAQVFKEQYHRPRLKDLDNMKKYRRQ